MYFTWSTLAINNHVFNLSSSFFINRIRTFNLPNILHLLHCSELFESVNYDRWTRWQTLVHCWHMSEVREIAPDSVFVHAQHHISQYNPISQSCIIEKF